MENPKVTNIDKNNNPAAVDVININFQLNPPKIIKQSNPIGNVKKGKRYDRHKYPAEESPFLHDIIEISIESNSRTAIGMTIKCNFKIPGPKLSGGYLIKLNCSSCGQFNDVKKFRNAKNTYKTIPAKYSLSILGYLSLSCNIFRNNCINNKNKTL